MDAVTVIWGAAIIGASIYMGLREVGKSIASRASVAVEGGVINIAKATLDRPPSPTDQGDQDSGGDA